MAGQPASRYKIIALDMDGTLLNRNQEISDQNRKWIQAAVEAGVKVILATSRPVRGVIRFAEELNLDTPYIVSNASEIWKSSEQLYRRYVFDAETKIQIVEVLRRHEEDIQFGCKLRAGSLIIETGTLRVRMGWNGCKWRFGQKTRTG